MHNLLGIHHVTAMTNDAERNYQFITQVLGMRLVKKTVNQDDIHTYHTFFADDVGSPGTDLTFFAFPGQEAGRDGTNMIHRIGLRVPNDEALAYYLKRLSDFNVDHGEIYEYNGHQVFDFEEEDGQKYRLYSDEKNVGVPAGTPWKNGPVPLEYAIYGLGPIEIKVSYFDEFKTLMQEIYRMKIVQESEDTTLLEIGEGGHGGQMILIKDTATPIAYEGYGQVHHVSFRVADSESLDFWRDRYDKLGKGHSGHVDRYFFEALYTRIGHILLELSTDGPGFMGDEPYETLGESLSLPPFLEPHREYIEAQIKPFDTRQSK